VTSSKGSEGSADGYLCILLDSSVDGGGMLFFVRPLAGEVASGIEVSFCFIRWDRNPSNLLRDVTEGTCRCKSIDQVVL
jgi:hypothetical protein